MTTRHSESWFVFVRRFGSFMYHVKKLHSFQAFQSNSTSTTTKIRLLVPAKSRKWLPNIQSEADLEVLPSHSLLQVSGLFFWRKMPRALESETVRRPYLPHLLRQLDCLGKRREPLGYLDFRPCKNNSSSKGEKMTMKEKNSQVLPTKTITKYHQEAVRKARSEVMAEALTHPKWTGEKGVNQKPSIQFFKGSGRREV